MTAKKRALIFNTIMPGIVASLAAVLAAPGAAHAGGLFVPGMGPFAQGRAGAFVAKADDPSALAYNPAGFAKQDGWVVQVGSNFINYDLTFTRAGVYEDAPGVDLPFEGEPYAPVKDSARPKVGVGGFQAVPLIAVSGDIGIPNLRIGFGLFAPQSAPNRRFAPGYQFEQAGVAPPPQRYDTMRQKSSAALPSVAVAYRVLDKLDVGARFSAGFGEVTAESYVWGLRNYEEWVARDGRFSVNVKDNFIPAFGFGALYRPSDDWEIGLAYSSKFTVDAKGTGGSILGSDLRVGTDQEFIEPKDDAFTQCAPGGVDQNNLKACLTFDVPQHLTVGGRWIMRDGAGKERGDIEFDVRWENWSSADEISVIVDGQSGLTGLGLNETIIRHGFDDVFSFRLGGSYKIAVAGSDLGLRAGVAYDTATAPNSWQRVDIDGASRITIGTGVSYWINKVRIDVGGGFVVEPTRNVPQCNPSVGSEGCPEGTGAAAQVDRTSPDPSQPLIGPNNQFQSPFNAGKYESSYLMFALGLTYKI